MRGEYLELGAWAQAVGNLKSLEGSDVELSHLMRDWCDEEGE